MSNIQIMIQDQWKTVYLSITQNNQPAWFDMTGTEVCRMGEEQRVWRGGEAVMPPPNLYRQPVQQVQAPSPQLLLPGPANPGPVPRQECNCLGILGLIALGLVVAITVIGISVAQ